MAFAISVNQVSKLYRVGTKLTNLRELFSIRKDGKLADYRWAVKNVSFAVQPGESLGIIGPNGAGKTTILKMLSRVTKPTYGEIVANGRLSALIELGAGFHPDLTGRENIYLNGTILGMRRSEIRDRFDEIIDFAGIEEYLDSPVKRYSSGMYARLGFAIAAHVDPQVLLVDEVLAVGDYAFQQKCYSQMDKLRSNGTSLILVAHNMEAIRRVCNRGIVMYHGESIFEGSAVEAVNAYSEALRQAAKKSKIDVPKENGVSERVMTFDAEIRKVNLLNETRQPTTVLQSGSTASVIVDVCFHKDVSRPIFSFFVRTPDGRLIYDTTTRWRGILTPNFSANEQCLVEFELDVALLEGEYEFGVDVGAYDLSHYYDRIERAMGFIVRGNEGAKGLVDLSTKISFKKVALSS